MIAYPDISSFQAGFPVQGIPAIAVKATEGTGYVNPDYYRVANAARAGGITLIAYHFLYGGDPAAQATYFHGVVGPNVATMIDVESSGATVADTLAFASWLRRIGGLPRLVYLPHWYWQQLGSPDLRSFTSVGLGLVSSNYTSYSDTGPGWAPYGGVSPTVWQFTDHQQVNGRAVDMNAYRGTASEFRAYLYGAPAAVAPSPTVPTVSGVAAMATVKIPPTLAAEFADIPGFSAKFPPNATTDSDVCAVLADGRAEAATWYARQARDGVGALGPRLDAILAAVKASPTPSPVVLSAAQISELAASIVTDIAPNLAAGGAITAAVATAEARIAAALTAGAGTTPA